MDRIISPERAYAIALQWGSFLHAGDPGVCLYGLHYGDGRPIDEQHRGSCLRYLRSIEHLPSTARDRREMRMLIRFMERTRLRPVVPPTTPASAYRSVRTAVVSAREGLIDWSDVRSDIAIEARGLMRALVPWLAEFARLCGVIAMMMAVLLAAMLFAPEVPVPV